MRMSPYVRHQDHDDRAGCNPNVEAKSITIFIGYSNVPLRGFSRMRGNSHVRFLEDGGAVMRRCYPIIQDWAGEDGSFTTLRMTWERIYSFLDENHFAGREGNIEARYDYLDIQ